MFYVDILEFAGLSFVILGIFKKMNFSNSQLLTARIIISILGLLLKFSDFRSMPPNILFEYFIGTSYEYTEFPLFSMIIFPIAEYLYGHYFIKTKDKSGFFRLWQIFIIIPIIYFRIYMIFIYGSYGTFPEGYYFYTSPLLTLFCLILVHWDLRFSF